MNRHKTKRFADARLDWFGGTASCLCAVHCGVSALLPAAFGALGLGFLLGHAAEWVFTAVAVTFAAAASLYGWRRHRSTVVVGLLMFGIAGLLGSRAIEVGGAHAHHGEQEHAHHEAHGEPHVEGESESDPHLLGAAIGVPAGLLLVLGHALNFQAARRSRPGEEECSTG